MDQNRQIFGFIAQNRKRISVRIARVNRDAAARAAAGIAAPKKNPQLLKPRVGRGYIIETNFADGHEAFVGLILFNKLQAKFKIFRGGLTGVVTDRVIDLELFGCMRESARPQHCLFVGTDFDERADTVVDQALRDFFNSNTPFDHHVQMAV